MVEVPSENRSLARRLVYSALVMAVFVAAVELGIRALNPETGFFFTIGRDNCIQRSKIFGLGFAPGCQGTIKGAVDTRFTTNSDGLRDTEIADDGAIRILTMGDSCTWGWGLAQDDSYPRALQRLLDERIGSGRYRVINAGVPGTTAYQGVRYLRAAGLALDPAIVIFGYGFNDQLKVGDVEEWMRTVSHSVWIQSADDWLIDHSKAWRWIRWKTQPVPQKVGGQVPPKSPPDRYARNLAEIVTLARAHGAKPLMLKFYPKGLGPPYAQAIADVSAELHVPLIVYTGPTIDVAHPTKDGVRALAEAIYDQLVASAYVEAPGTAEQR